MRASVLVFLVGALYGAVPNSEAGQAWNALIDPQVYLTFPVFKYTDNCAYNCKDVSLDYRRAVYDFSVQLFKRVAAGGQLHVAYSPLSVWTMLAAMAEGADGPARDELFKVLHLPEDKCLRQQYYQLASKAELNGPDATLHRTRVLAYDDSLSFNQYWKNYIHENCLMNTLPVPMRRDPIIAESVMRDLISTRLSTAFSGNSAILDSLDYQSLWTSAFSDAIIENAPFYNDIGQQIGTMDMMKMKKQVRMGYLADFKMKVLELPVGYNGRYRMMMALSVGTTEETVDALNGMIVFQLLNKLQTSRIPIDIVIPRFTMTSEYDVRPFLEDMGVRSLWTDACATQNISDPAAKPSSLLQRVTLTFDQPGVVTSTEELPSFLSASSYDSDTGLDPILGRDFIANRPFLFGMLDTETYSVLFGSAFSRPPNSFVLKK